MQTLKVTRNLALALGVAAVSLAGAAAPSAGSGSSGGGGTLLRSGVAASLTSSGPVLFGVAPGGLPWVVDEGRVRVRADGRLKVRVEGLVIPTSPFDGTNPLDWLGASLFCGGMSAAVTDPVPYSDAGDARISQTVEVPDDCLAPVVLLHPASESAVNTAVYIAASGG